MNRFLILLVICLQSVYAQADFRKFKSVKVIADTSGFWFLSGNLPVGCEVNYEGGKRRRTSGYLNGNMSWKNFKLTSDQAVFRSGAMIIDLDKALKNNRRVVVTVTMPGEKLSNTCVFTLPTLANIAVLVPETQQLLPGVSFNPHVSFYFSNGKQYRTNPWNKNSFIQGDKLTLFYNKDTVTDGMIRIPKNVIESGDRLTLSVVWNENHSLYDVRIYRLDFNYVEYKVYKSSAGKDGANGLDGEHNQNGGNGMNGERGGNGAEVHVYMRLNEDRSILYITTKSGNIVDEMAVKPGIGKVDIEAKGGNGGNGGSGGYGGNAESDSGDAGGIGGNGGNGGDGGDGGIIKIWCDSLAEEFLTQLNINNLGGSGGFGGRRGKGGSADESSGSFLVDLFFSSRNAAGSNGEPGRQGKQGPEAEINLVSLDDLKRQMELDR